MFGPYIGMYAFGYLLCGYLTGIGNRIFYKEDITFPVLMIAAADLFYGCYMYIFGFMIRGRLNVLFYLRRIILPEAVYTVIIAVFLYRIILIITEHLQKWRLNSVSVESLFDKEKYLSPHGNRCIFVRNEVRYLKQKGFII